MPAAQYDGIALLAAVERWRPSNPASASSLQGGGGVGGVDFDGSDAIGSQASACCGARSTFRSGESIAHSDGGGWYAGAAADVVAAAADVVALRRSHLIARRGLLRRPPVPPPRQLPTPRLPKT